jgi:hypothetical protein
MKSRTLRCLIALPMLASCAVFSCSQAPAECVVGHAGSGLGYGTTLAIKGDMPPCASDPKFTHASGVLLKDVKGDVFGLETYHPKSRTEEAPDYTQTSVAIKADSLGAMADLNGADDEHPPYAFGKFKTLSPGSDNFCAVTLDQPAEQNFAGITEIDLLTGDPKADAMMKPLAPQDVNVKYAWNDFKLYVTPAAPGTQFSGDLTYTQSVGADSCTVTYHAVGMWPAVDCGVYNDYTGDADDTDPDSCLPDADTEAGRPVGSGINPDFPVECIKVREKALNERVRDVVCKDNKGVLAVTTEDGACPEDVFCADAAGAEVMPGADMKCPMGSTEKPVYTLICDGKDMAGMPVVVEPDAKGKCPMGSSARLDVAYEDAEDPKHPRVAVPIPATGPKQVPATARAVLSNVFPALALCLLTGDPPQFKKSAE